MQTPFLVGNRLYLRPLEKEDLDRCVRWINDSEVTSTLLLRFPMNQESEQKWFASQYQDNTNIILAIVVQDGDRHIGNCGLHKIDYVNRNAEFGIMIGEKKEWGKGYAPEAAFLILDYGFRQLGLHRIGLEVFSHNPRAQRVYEKVGFVREGAKRESYFRDGQFHDTIVMGILKPQWKSYGVLEEKG
jgi:RimJ/RimL family protein N-acetyltransferase